MSNLLEFIESSEGKETKVELGKELARTETSIATIVGSISLKEFSVPPKDFASNVARLVESKEFLSRASDAIGEPTEGESKEEFIERSKQALHVLIKESLPE